MIAKDLLRNSRAFEKAPLAVNILAAREGTLAERLTAAWLELGMLTGRPLPEEFQERYDYMHALATEKGSYEQSIAGLEAEDAQNLARLMVAFALDVAAAMSQG